MLRYTIVFLVIALISGALGVAVPNEAAAVFVYGFFGSSLALFFLCLFHGRTN